MHLPLKKIIATFFVAALGASSAIAAGVNEVKVGYTSIVPETLIAKNKGWIEEELKPLGVSVKWVESLGSNKTIEFLRGKHLDIGPSSLASAFLARANGTPIKYVYWNLRQPSGSPILVKNTSSFKSISDLKGKKIAATPGTGPYISLIAALKKHNLTKQDVEIVSLQHAQGRVALAAGRVDAWAGLDPDWAIAELENNARVLFADPDLAGGGGIDVRDEFLEKHPEIVKAVLKGFDRARIYTLQNTNEAVATFAEATKVDIKVAERVLKRGTAEQPAIEQRDFKALATWGNLYKELGDIPASTNVDAVVKEVLDPSVFTGTASK
jgi:sulfonate transport system substrate-binding protein